MKGLQITIADLSIRLDNSVEFVATDILIQASNDNTGVTTLISSGGAIIELTPGQVLSIQELGMRDNFFFLSKDWLVNGTVGDKLNISYEGRP